VPTALLADPARRRSRQPQASVAALGAAAEHITEHQPFAYALGADSPFSRLYVLKAQIVLLGVGHDRNSFLHHAESLVPGLGTARCELVDAVPFIDFARKRLEQLLRAAQEPGLES
jgi:aminoglycoside N3'-acetyltransferase